MGFRFGIHQEREVARGETHEVVAAGLADAQLAPCAAPLALLAVLATHHAGHGLEDVVGPDVLRVACIAVEVLVCDLWDEREGHGDGLLG